MRNRIRVMAIVLAFVIAIAVPVLAQTPNQTTLISAPAKACVTAYYVSSTGNDNASGLSIQNAWRSIAKVNKVTFNKGSCLFFEGGMVFPGSIYFDRADRGSPAQPIRVGSYGKGRATIVASKSDGIYAYNTAGFEIRDLTIRGDANYTLRTNGISFYTDLASNTKLPYIKIERVEVSQFGANGIAIGSWNEASPYAGFANVTLTEIEAHDNGDAGIMSYGYAPAKAAVRTAWPHSNFVLSRSRVYDNKGIPTKTTTFSGNGAVFGQVEGLVMEHNESFGNGSLSNGPSGGPVGLWAYDCKDVLMQFNESHHNSRGKAVADGGGFNLDGGSVNSIVQFNYSHHNEGPGFLIAQYANAAPLKNLTFRYNISAYDGSRSSAGISVWSDSRNPFGVQNAYFLHNTVITDQGAAQVVKVQGGSISNVFFANNIFLARSPMLLVSADQPFSSVNFYGNYYWNTDGTFRVHWNGTTYRSLRAWRAISKELHSGAATGANTDPLLLNPSQALTVRNRDFSLLSPYYSLAPNSLARSAGLNLSAFNLAPSGRDFFRRSVNRLLPSVGAAQ
ncbi:MAG: right-handed parallel beta-helix repeat-containing protein [Myxacorys californica WJT36-NPBG1]|jgi:hypothetical protein|nr:right-handed parallel beta-helix repeat-containing protein [Myxacorys californica WJT36-NPBG1]